MANLSTDKRRLQQIIALLKEQKANMELHATAMLQAMDRQRHSVMEQFESPDVAEEEMQNLRAQFDQAERAARAQQDALRECLAFYDIQLANNQKQLDNLP